MWRTFGKNTHKAGVGENVHCGNQVSFHGSHQEAFYSRRVIYQAADISGQRYLSK